MEGYILLICYKMIIIVNNPTRPHINASVRCVVTVRIAVIVDITEVGRLVDISQPPIWFRI